MGSDVMGKLLCIELQLGYLVLQLALRTHPNVCHRNIAMLLRNGLQDDCVFC